MFKKLLVLAIASACMSFNYAPYVPERPGIKGDQDRSREFYSSKEKDKKVTKAREFKEREILNKLREKGKESKKRKN